jgi:fimbrial chaperone protein
MPLLSARARRAVDILALATARFARAAGAAAALAAALAAAPAAAGDLELTPILVDLSASTRTSLVKLRNAGGAPMRYQVKAYAWAQGNDGKMDLQPARDLVVFPPLVELASGEARNLRVGAEATPGAAERAWRLVVEELPRRDVAPGTQVQVLTRVTVPVFFAPARAAASGELVFLSRDGGKVRFTLRNTGTVRLRPTEVTLALRAKDGAAVLERPLDAWYVLAGGERVYEVELPADACAKAAQVVVTAALDAGAIEARAQGACRGP